MKSRTRALIILAAAAAAAGWTASAESAAKFSKYKRPGIKTPPDRTHIDEQERKRAAADEADEPLVCFECRNPPGLAPVAMWLEGEDRLVCSECFHRSQERDDEAFE